MFKLVDENFQRMEEDLVWLSDKFDYRNKDADWKNSKDALQRGTIVYNTYSFAQIAINR